VSDPRPLIGLTTYQEQARWTVWDLPAVLLPVTYVQAVVAAGGLPVLLPPLPEVIEAALPWLDGLLLSGGPDIDPARYGRPPLETTGAPRPERDDAEHRLTTAALAAGTPILGICRGLQLLNVVRGGTLHQHLPDLLDSTEHAPAPAVYGRHRVDVTPGSRLATTLGRTELDTPSSHHQAIDRLGSGLTASALATDGTIEAIEDPALPFCLAVQWHPEVDDDLSLFRALVAASAMHR
jgi:putative glutamine amidotransferase